MRGPYEDFRWKSIPPTSKKFRADFCTNVHWQNGEIVEEKLFYDLPSVL